jgi:histidyl-tRNA synthetase
VIVGKREMEAGKVTLKDMESGEQHQLTVEDAREHILKSGW